MTRPKALILEKVHRSRHQLVLSYRVDDLKFHTDYWYDTVDFFELEERYGQDFMDRIYFNLLAFEANKAASLAPETLDPGPYKDYCSARFAEVWSTIFANVWGVWRHGNNIPHYRGPEVPLTGAEASPIRVQAGPTPTLALCGGGKDSLVMMKLMERASVPYDTFVYSHNIYGKAQPQHTMINAVLDHCQGAAHHRGWVYDTAVDSPAAIVCPEYGVKHLLSAETVSSYFTALPVALAYGHTDVALGITRSTDEHNLFWEETGEEINYLWGMSHLAEQLLGDYIQAELSPDLKVYHLLRSAYDLPMFGFLSELGEAIWHTHSCAQVKPWCGRCPKCLYVFMHYLAWLPEDKVLTLFGKNLFDLEENRDMLVKMLGLEGFKPCDCVGTVSEARLAYLGCQAKGYGMSGVDCPSDDASELLTRYTEVLDTPGCVPDALFEKVRPLLVQGAEKVRELYSSPAMT
jgi:hypothetical protein